MIRTCLAASVAVAALALHMPSASASDAVYDCRLRSVQQDTVTGNEYRGVLTGVVASPSGGAVGIRCRVLVNGATVAQTGTGTGTPVASSAGTVSFVAEDTDVVQLCTDVTDHGTTRTVCLYSVGGPFPPDWVVETLNAAFTTVFSVADPVLCGVLQNVAGDHPGGVVVNEQGDVYLNGQPQYDCPPYDIVWD